MQLCREHNHLIHNIPKGARAIDPEKVLSALALEARSIDQPEISDRSCGATMTDDGEKICPLCAEEMDLTDQQLKPCRCGYEICVWCWHHIVDMAEKDDTEGRCPACRTPYDKEKIVGTVANCERMVAEMISERKKSHKPKPKNSEGRKHLSSVRVVQRNLVYVNGLPANLADVDILERKEYFGQYGKVLKVSVTHPSGGSQHHSSNTASVYITYTKEEEAVRCIQAVHGFTLDGRILRACFGTTKYCHAWLRNMPCTNPDCLYLHEIGVQEDSFTKDEIISAYTRVQQITGSTHSLDRRSGNVLPPSGDDLCSSSGASPAKPVVRVASNNMSLHLKASPPHCCSGRSSILPAAASWGLRASNCRSASASAPCIQGIIEAVSEAFSSPSIVSHAPGSVLHDVGETSTTAEERTVSSNTRLGQLVSPNSSSDTTTVGKIMTAADSGGASVISSVDSSTMSVDKKRDMIISPEISLSADELGMEYNVPVLGHISEISSPNIAGSSHQISVVLSSCIHPARRENNFDTLGTPAFTESGTLAFPVENIENGLSLVFKGPSFFSHSSSSGRNLRLSDDDNLDSSGQPNSTVNRRVGEISSLVATGMPILSDRYKDNSVSTLCGMGNSFVSSADLLSTAKGMASRRVDGDEPRVNQNAGIEMESSIISNILSLELDSWDDSLRSPHKLVKMLTEHDQMNGSQGLPVSSKLQKESKFLFARQEDFINQGSNLQTSLNNCVGVQRCCLTQQNTGHDKSYFGGRFLNGSRDLSLCSAASKAHMSAPPGFSFSSRVPPPGFSQERLSHLDILASGNQAPEISLLRSPFLASNDVCGSTSDVEFVDPAILAVGRGRLQIGTSNFGSKIPSSTVQSSSSENDIAFQLLMQQQGILSNQNLPYSGLDDRFLNINDSVLSSRLVRGEKDVQPPFAQVSPDQSGQSHFFNGQWGSWNDIITGNEMGFSFDYRPERSNRYYPGCDGIQGRIGSFNSTVNKAFGM